MNNLDKIYTGLCVLFSTLIVICNLVYQKFVTINLVGIYNFEISSGALLYPLTFMITDIVAEIFGPSKSRFLVRMALINNIVVVLILSFLDSVPTASWSKISASDFHKIFGFYSIAFFGSLVAFFVSQNIDIYIYLYLKKMTRGKFMFFRNILSSGLCLFIDTFIVISIMTYFGVIPFDQMLQLLINSYFWKLLFTILFSPLFYLSVKIIKFYI